MNIYGLIALNTVNVDASVALQPIQAFLFNQAGQLVQMIDIPEPPPYTQLTTCTFTNIGPGTYTGTVFRRTTEGDLAGPSVSSNPIVITGLLGVATVVAQNKEQGSEQPEQSKEAVAPQKQITVPANFVLVAI